MLRLDWNLLFTIINLIVLYVCMKKFLYGPITAIMDKRQNMIREQLANATQTEEEARQMKNRYEAALQGAKDESGKIVDQARAEAKSEYERILGGCRQGGGQDFKGGPDHCGDGEGTGVIPDPVSDRGPGYDGHRAAAVPKEQRPKRQPPLRCVSGGSR